MNCTNERGQKNRKHTIHFQCNYYELIHDWIMIEQLLELLENAFISGNIFMWWSGASMPTYSCDGVGPQCQHNMWLGGESVTAYSCDGVGPQCQNIHVMECGISANIFMWWSVASVPTYLCDGVGPQCQHIYVMEWGLSANIWHS